MSQTVNQPVNDQGAHPLADQGAILATIDQGTIPAVDQVATMTSTDLPLLSPGPPLSLELCLFFSRHRHLFLFKLCLPFSFHGSLLHVLSLPLLSIRLAIPSSLTKYVSPHPAYLTSVVKTTPGPSGIGSDNPHLSIGLLGYTSLSDVGLQGNTIIVICSW